MSAAKRKESEPSFDAALVRLEAIVKRLEEEEIPLEESLKLFGEGQTLARLCESQLRAAENQVRQLLEGAGGDIIEQIVAAEEAEQAGAATETPSEPAGEANQSDLASQPGNAPSPPERPKSNDDLPF